MSTGNAILQDEAIALKDHLGEFQDLLDEIIEYTRPPTLQSGEFTRRMYQERCMERGHKKPTNDHVIYVLERMVDEGLLTKRDVLVNSKKAKAYKPTPLLIDRLAEGDEFEY